MGFAFRSGVLLAVLRLEFLTVESNSRSRTDSQLVADVDTCFYFNARTDEFTDSHLNAGSYADSHSYTHSYEVADSYTDSYAHADSDSE